ncbi:MAG TPA: orotate phosphoribosyltransferase [Polyangiaceae bacterium]|nr:orotate phosphoribosyltransferase [Polyangiaceae bacterium]
MTDSRTRLIDLLRDLSFQKKRVILASGRESDFFIDCKQTILTAEGHALVGELMFEALNELAGPGPVEAVGGVELGGCPLASAVSLVSFQKGRPLPALYVRKERKDHGSAKRIEGDRALRPGLRVALLEDVVTTGGSSLKALDVLREAGCEVAGIVALVDRLEGGREAIEAAGVKLITLATRRDFLPD